MKWNTMSLSHHFAAISAFCLIINNVVAVGLRASSRRLDEVQLMHPIDAREICSGPRREIHNGTLPYHEHELARYGLHVGHTSMYGETNNQIITVFNAMDTALNSGKVTVVAVSGWAEKFLTTFFPDDASWETLSHDLPIVRSSAAHDLTPLLHHSTSSVFLRDEEVLKERNAWEVTQSRRLAFLHYIFSSLDGEPCDYWHKLQQHLYDRYDGVTQYIAIHVRHMDGKCTLFNKWHHEQCSMNATFIESIVKPTGLYGKVPIVLLSDMQDPEKLRKIQREVQKVIIPEWDLGIRASVLADIVIGSSSEYFIGNRGSSMSRNIGLIREAFGKDPSTNYIKLEKTEDDSWTSRRLHHPYSWRWDAD